MASASAWSADRLLVEEFLSALRAEHDALVAGETDALEGLADRKLACAGRLEREASPGFSAMLRATQAQLRRGEKAAQPEDAELHRLVQQANELNRLNGVLIGQHLGLIRLSLARLDPVSPTRQIYGRDGQGHSNHAGRSFGAF